MAAVRPSRLTGRHLNVGDYNIGRMGFDTGEQLIGVAGDIDDCDPLALQQADHARPDQRVVVGNDDLNHETASAAANASLHGGVI